MNRAYTLHALLGFSLGRIRVVGVSGRPTGCGGGVPGTIANAWHTGQRIRVPTHTADTRKSCRQDWHRNGTKATKSVDITHPLEGATLGGAGRGQSNTLPAAARESGSRLA